MLDLHDSVVGYWSCVLRCACMDFINNNPIKLGGEGVIVEIDECVWRRRKYKRGRKKKQIWIFGAIERTENENEIKKKFINIVPDRSAKTLLPIIRQHILPGTTIMSDEWKAYSSLEAFGYIHKTVCHKRNFVDPLSGACTNTIEGMWSHLRGFFPKHGVRERFLWDYLAFWMVKNTKQLAFQDVVHMIVYRKEEEIEEQILEEQDKEEDDELTDENIPDIDDFDSSESSNEKKDESTDSLGLSDGADASEWVDE